MYELVYIVPAPFSEKDLPSISAQVKNLITEQEGEIIREKNLGEKRFVYKIKQAWQGFYLLLEFKISSEKIKVLNEKLKHMPEILRYLIVKTP